MKSYLPATVLGFALTAAAVGFGAATAHATDYPQQSSTQVSSEMSPTGYPVQENGAANGELSRCTGTGVDGLTTGSAVGAVYIDLSCPSSNN